VDVRNSPKKRAIAITLQHSYRLLRQRNTLFLERLEASLQVLEAEFQAEGRGESFEDAAPCGDDFAADAVAGDERWNSG
jgi:hypothetical protein